MMCLTRTSRYRSKRRSWLVPLLPTVGYATIKIRASIIGSACQVSQTTQVKLCFQGSTCKVSQLTQVKLCFQGSACQVSQLTCIKLCFPCGSGCQVSQQIKCSHIQVDCLIHTTLPEPIAIRFGQLLIVECLFNCRQARLKFGRFPKSIFYQCQCKSKLNHVNPYTNVSMKSHDPF